MNLGLIFLGFFLLVVGGEFIVRSSVALSLRFNISKFVIGMTVVSFATSLPELLVIFLLSFIYNVLKKSDSNESFNDIDDKLKLTSNFKILIWLIISSLTLYFGAEFLVEGAVNLAKQINISEAVISVTLVAIGTSIPELAASLVAVAKNEKGISVGNLIGSNIFNIGSVLGITAIIKDISIAQEIIQRDIIWMLMFATIIMVLAVLPEKNKISKYKGIIMLLGYFVFIFQAFT